MIGWRRHVFAKVALAGLLALAPGACSNEDGPLRPSDSLPPTVTVVEPAENAFVPARPAFVIRVSDQGSGVFCSTVSATINGRDVSQFFRNGCDEATGEIRIGGGQITPPLNDGGATLVFTISDHAGNVSPIVRRQFTVDSEPPPPPPPD